METYYLINTVTSIIICSFDIKELTKEQRYAINDALSCENLAIVSKNELKDYIL